MLPRIHPQQDIDIRAPVRDFTFLPGKERRAAERAGAHHGIVVLLLPPVVRARERRAGEVGRQDGEFVVHHGGVPVLVSDEPDEAGAEHGVGGRDEGFPERVGGGEGLADFGGEDGGYWWRVWGEGGEELVVGPGHAGVVEEGGEKRLAGVGEDEIFCGGHIGRGACGMEFVSDWRSRYR